MTSNGTRKDFWDEMGALLEFKDWERLYPFVFYTQAQELLMDWPVV